jgi:hypothetical protein
MQCLTDLIFLLVAVVSFEEPAVYYSVMLLSAVSQVGLPSILTFTTMSDSQSLNTSLLEVMISSKNKGVCIRDL